MLKYYLTHFITFIYFLDFDMCYQTCDTNCSIQEFEIFYKNRLFDNFLCID